MGGSHQAHRYATSRVRAFHLKQKRVCPAVSGQVKNRESVSCTFLTSSTICKENSSPIVGNIQLKKKTYNNASLSLAKSNAFKYSLRTFSSSKFLPTTLIIICPANNKVISIVLPFFFFIPFAFL